MTKNTLHNHPKDTSRTFDIPAENTYWERDIPYGMSAEIEQAPNQGPVGKVFLFLVLCLSRHWLQNNYLIFLTIRADLVFAIFISSCFWMWIQHQTVTRALCSTLASMKGSKQYFISPCLSTEIGSSALLLPIWLCWGQDVVSLSHWRRPRWSMSAYRLLTWKCTHKTWAACIQTSWK